MSKWLVMALVLGMAGGAWAHELHNQYDEEIKHNHPTKEDNFFITETNSFDTDRFLREQVEPLIKDGDSWLTLGKANDKDGKWDTLYQQRAIARYLKALVLIEQERLRRDAR